MPEIAKGEPSPSNTPAVDPDGLVAAWMMDGRGGGRIIGWDEIRGWTPDEGLVWVHLDLPGVAADSIDISVERNVLTVTGERSWQRQEGDQVSLAERRTGTFRRQVTLGDGLDAELFRSYLAAFDEPEEQIVVL